MDVRNRYVSALGWIAAVAVGLTVFGVVITLLSGAPAVAALGSPIGIIGGIFGALWLITKAITWQMSLERDRDLSNH